MILLRDVSKSFGSLRAVDRVGFELDRGGVSGLLGPNGAGKTTTLRLITGILAPDAGRVEIDGRPTPSSSHEARARIGYLPESAPLHPEMTPAAYARYRARLHGLSGRDASRRADAALDACRVRDVARRRIGHLSKGYRQRVALAGAMVHDPPVLVLDEPTNGLDPTQIRQARSLILELAERRTMLVSSHILPEIERLCDRVLVMAGGRLRADGSPAELIAATPGAGCVMEVLPSQDDAPAVLNAVVGVASARLDPEVQSGPWRRIVVAPERHGHDLREALGAEALARGWTVRELRPTAPTLEHAFVAIMDRDANREAKP